MAGPVVTGPATEGAMATRQRPNRAPGGTNAAATRRWIVALGVLAMLATGGAFWLSFGTHAGPNGAGSTASRDAHSADATANRASPSTTGMSRGARDVAVGEAIQGDRSTDADALRDRESAESASEPLTPGPGGGDEPEMDPVDARLRERYGEPSPALVHAAVADVVARRFGDRGLDAEQIARASDALVELREARLRLAELPVESRYATERRRLLDRMSSATETFTETLGVDPARFTAIASVSGGSVDGSPDSARATARDPNGEGDFDLGSEFDVGIDDAHDPDYVPDDDFLESRR